MEKKKKRRLAFECREAFKIADMNRVGRDVTQPIANWEKSSVANTANTRDT